MEVGSRMVSTSRGNQAQRHNSNYRSPTLRIQNANLFLYNPNWHSPWADLDRPVLIWRFLEGDGIRSLLLTLNCCWGRVTRALWDTFAAQARSLGSWLRKPVFWSVLEMGNPSVPPLTCPTVDQSAFRLRHLFLFPYEYFPFQFTLCSDIVNVCFIETVRGWSVQVLVLHLTVAPGNTVPVILSHIALSLFYTLKLLDLWTWFGLQCSPDPINSYETFSTTLKVHSSVRLGRQELVCTKRATSSNSVTYPCRA